MGPSFGEEALRIQRSAMPSGPAPPSSGGMPTSAPDLTASQSSEAPLKAPPIRVSLPEQPAQASDPKPLKANLERNVPRKEGLTEVELKRLAAHDIVLLIDKSGSMDTPDCPVIGGATLGMISSFVLGGMGSTTRWNWCLGQTSTMANQTQDVLKDGFSVILFDSNFQIFPHVTVDGLRTIFHNNRPEGGTDLTSPLAGTFEDYFRRKKITNGNVKPLLIGIITDGCPSSPESVRTALFSVTRQLSNPSEITVVFFLIGSRDFAGEQFAHSISRFNIVKVVPYSQLASHGLARALAENLD
jgi:hypothetical protein